MPLTETLAGEPSRKLERIQPEDGGDDLEDVADGIDLALRGLAWGENASRCILSISDHRPNERDTPPKWPQVLGDCKKRRVGRYDN